MEALQGPEAGMASLDLPPVLFIRPTLLISVPGTVSEAGTQCSTRTAREPTPTELMADMEETASNKLPHKCETAFAACVSTEKFTVF